MTFKKSIALLFVLLFLASPAGAESLWVDGASLVADHRPGSIGDIVTVKVTEQTETEDAANTEIDKDGSFSAEDGVGIFDFIKRLGVGASSSMEGDASRERSHSVTTTITCMVTEVLPGGNIRLEGRKDFVVQKETMTMKFSGIARPRDVGPDNTIESDRLADVTVEVEGVGSISDVQHPGFLTRLFNIIF
jgi:flagellar L-ring protein precursor FlgH